MKIKKSQMWRNQTFCFRVSLVFVFVWLAISSTISLIAFFSFADEGFAEFMFEFSTWFFALPAITLFGLINTIPLILDWLLEVFENNSEKEAVTDKVIPKKISTYNKLVEQIEQS